MSDIKHLRLMNGEELISEIYCESNEGFWLINPLYPTSGETGETILMRYAPYDKSNHIKINKEHVLMCTDVHQEMRRHYYLSLKVTADYEKHAMEALRGVNDEMERSLVSPRRRKTGILVPGSNMKH